jgi:pimeloyl-ACP methyl ester carboxylesterase
MASDYLLVHGPGYGNWIWDELRGALNKARSGYTVVHGSHNRFFDGVGSVVAEDLPGHRTFQSPNNGSITLKEYTDYLSNLVDQRGLQNLVLVGHGGAGFLLPYLAERIPVVKHMVFVGSAIPNSTRPTGNSLGKLMRDLMSLDSVPGLRDTMIGSYSLTWQTLFLLRSMLKLEDHRGVGKLHKALALPLLCNGAAHGVAGSMIGKSVASPFEPWVSPIEPRPSDIPSSAVLFKHDRILPLKKQRKKAQAYGASSVIEFDGGHLSGIAKNGQGIAEYLLTL